MPEILFLLFQPNNKFIDWISLICHFLCVKFPRFSFFFLLLLLFCFVFFFFFCFYFSCEFLFLTMRSLRYFSHLLHGTMVYKSFATNNHRLGLVWAEPWNLAFCIQRISSEKMSIWAAKRISEYQISFKKVSKKRRKQCFSDENVLMPKHLAIGKKLQKLHPLSSTLLNVYISKANQILYAVSLGWKRLHMVLGQIRSKLWLMATKIFNRLIVWGKCCKLHFNQIFLILAGNQDRTKISDEFDFRPDRTIHFGVTCPWALKTFPMKL